jgi:hypothetical protein
MAAAKAPSAQVKQAPIGVGSGTLGLDREVLLLQGHQIRHGGNLLRGSSQNCRRRKAQQAWTRLPMSLMVYFERKSEYFELPAGITVKLAGAKGPPWPKAVRWR